MVLHSVASAFLQGFGKLREAMDRCWVGLTLKKQPFFLLLLLLEYWALPREREVGKQSKRKSSLRQKEAEGRIKREKMMDTWAISGNTWCGKEKKKNTSGNFTCVHSKRKRGSLYSPHFSKKSHQNHIPVVSVLNHYTYLNKLRASSCRLGHEVQQYWRGISLVLVRDTVCTVAREM